MLLPDASLRDTSTADMRQRVDHCGEHRLHRHAGIAEAGQPHRADEHAESSHQSMRQRIERVRADLKDLRKFYNIEVSDQRRSRLQKYYEEQLADLKNAPFDCYDQQGKVDYLLLKTYLERSLSQLGLDAAKDKKTEPLLPFASIIIRLCEDRQQMKPVDGEKAARDLDQIEKHISIVRERIESGAIKVDATCAFRAAKTVDQLCSHLKEWKGFYTGYDPMFTWWVKSSRADKLLEGLAASIREKLVGLDEGDTDTIIGDPIGREGLLKDLDAEKIPYTPEELISIGENEYEWCLSEMKAAAHELGYEDWRSALEYVKNLYVEPGKQTSLVHFLATEAIDFVKENDLITVPPLAEEVWRMSMIEPERQRVNPYFLGGRSIQVSYPTDEMNHQEKLMSMRGNNVHFSRSTVFHELIPGHNLQTHMMARYRPYRTIFTTPFWIEGWSLYWEMILWANENFPKTPENRIGMLFWRMHRCARIIFSINFHLGKMTPQECIELLIHIGHDRFTAEGEVRRSFAGDYSPLYQAGYMLGALQLYALRNELLRSGTMSEKTFHDRIMRENQMPIELLRALLGEQPLVRDYKSSWRFYKSL